LASRQLPKYAQKPDSFESNNQILSKPNQHGVSTAGF